MITSKDNHVVYSTNHHYNKNLAPKNYKYYIVTLFLDEGEEVQLVKLIDMRTQFTLDDIFEVFHSMHKNLNTAFGLDTKLSENKTLDVIRL